MCVVRCMLCVVGYENVSRFHPVSIVSIQNVEKSKSRKNKNRIFGHEEVLKTFFSRNLDQKYFSDGGLFFFFLSEKNLEMFEKILKIFKKCRTFSKNFKNVIIFRKFQNLKNDNKKSHNFQKIIIFFKNLKFSTTKKHFC